MGIAGYTESNATEVNMKNQFTWTLILRFNCVYKYLSIECYHQGEKSKLKLGFYVLFNSLGQFGTGSKHCHLWDSNPHRGDSLPLDAKLGNH